MLMCRVQGYLVCRGEVQVCLVRMFCVQRVISVYVWGAGLSSALGWSTGVLSAWHVLPELF